MAVLLYMINTINITMPRKSKIDIFNVMTPEELDKALKLSDCSVRYYKRLMAMKLISLGYSHKETANILLIGYRTVYRWAKKCEESGLNGLKPNFNGGRKSKFSKEDRVKFQKILSGKKKISMTDAQKILRDDFDLNFSLPYVCKLVRDLGFNYGSPRPKFREEPENAEEILKKTSSKQM